MAVNVIVNVNRSKPEQKAVGENNGVEFTKSWHCSTNLVHVLSKLSDVRKRYVTLQANDLILSRL